jgi:hypothetical protein
MLALRSEVMPAISRLRAVRTVLRNRIVEPGFSLFDALPAFVAFVGVSAGCYGQK